MTKFMYWLKTNVGKIDLDEVIISDKLVLIQFADIKKMLL